MKTLFVFVLIAAGIASAQVNPRAPYFGTGTALMPQQATVPATATPSTPATITTPLAATVTAPGALQTTTVNVASLPGITLGVGLAWNRGATNALAVDTTLAIRLNAASNVYSWTDVTTPVANPLTTSTIATSPVTTVTTGQPVPSTVTTGLGWIVAQNATGSVSLVLIGQAGLASSTAGTSPAFTGSIAAAFRLGKSNVYIMPYFKAGNPQLGTTGAVASFVLQPGFQLMYGFGK